MVQLILAALLFLGTHLGISSSPLRGRLAGALGERGYLLLYSAVAAASLVYLIQLYNELPRFDYLWMPSPELHWVAKALVPVALILAVGAFLVRNPTALGGGVLPASGEDPEPARGVLRITRHPFQWGVLLWAVAHVAANGDTLSVVFFSTFAVLAGLGTLLLDRKKAATLGVAWGPFARATSNVPFLAILRGRNRLVLRELWLPVVLGLTLAMALFRGHAWVSGVRIF